MKKPREAGPISSRSNRDTGDCDAMNGRVGRLGGHSRAHNARGVAARSYRIAKAPGGRRWRQRQAGYHSRRQCL
jgi:hypothetical protein